MLDQKEPKNQGLFCYAKMQSIDIIANKGFLVHLPLLMHTYWPAVKVIRRNVLKMRYQPQIQLPGG